MYPVPGLAKAASQGHNRGSRKETSPDGVMGMKGGRSLEVGDGKSIGPELISAWITVSVLLNFATLDKSREPPEPQFPLLETGVSNPCPRSSVKIK